jgi:hypothetical protein
VIDDCEHGLFAEVGVGVLELVEELVAHGEFGEMVLD